MLSALFVLAAASCVSPTDNLRTPESLSQSVVTAVDVALDAANVRAGDRTTARAVMRNVAGDTVRAASGTIAWSSSNPAVARVSTSGRVTAVAPGSAVIRASVNGVIGRAHLAVLSAAIVMVRVSLASDTIRAGEHTQARVAAFDSAGRPIDGIAPRWHSRASQIATIDSNGTIIGVQRGRATIVANVGGVKDSLTVRVLRGGVAEPVFASDRDKLLVSDDFEGYTGITTGSLPFTRRYPVYRSLGIHDENIPLDSVVSLAPGRNGAGHAIRLSYGGAHGASDIIVGTDSRLDQVGKWNGTLPTVAGPYTHFIFSTWIRFSPGADPAGYDASGVKGVMLWHTGNQRYQAAPHRLELFSDDYDYPETRWDVGPPHPPNGITHLNHWKTADGQAPRFAPYTDGAWHRFTVEVYATSDPAGHRGERLWLDGVLVFDNVDNVGNLSWGGGLDYDYSHPVTHFMVFGNYIRGSIAALSPHFTVDFDDWTAWTN